MPQVLTAREYAQVEETAYERAYRENHEESRRKTLVKRMRKIQKKFDEIQTELSYCSNHEQSLIANFHTEGHTLQHCIRWGQQAAEELEAAARTNQLK